MNAKLKSYAEQVVSKGAVTNVWALNGNNIRGLLYELDLDVQHMPEDEAGEVIIDYLESYTSVDSHITDSYYKVGDRVFHLAFGAGASVVEVTRAFDPAPQSVLIASAPDDGEIQDIQRRAGIVH